jgi:hypothetical protein
MAKTNKELLNLLNSRLSLSLKFHESYKKEVEKALDDYNIDSFDKKNTGDLHNKLHIPYIFSTVESSLPSLFENVPNLLIEQGGRTDAQFSDYVNKTWDFIERTTDLKEVTEEVGFMFSLTGMGGATFDWEFETQEVEEVVQEPLINEMGEPVLKEDGIPEMVETIVKQEIPIVNRPYFEYKSYNQIYFSPESKFTSFDWFGDKIPYIIYKKSMNVDEVEYLYGVEVEPDEDMDISVLDDKMSIKEQDLQKAGINKTDLEKVGVYYYNGRLPKKESGDENWRPRNVYKVIFSKKKILTEPEVVEVKPCAFAGNYGSPEKFYRFGESKALRELEEDISYGRSILSDYRDRLATKIAIPEGTEVDEVALQSPKTFQVVRFIGDRYPQYITPPPVPEVVLTALQLSKEETQMVSGQFDLSKGSTQSVVDTATGQKIFSESFEKRVDRKKKKIGKFLEALAINILPMCAQYWDEQMFAKILDIQEEELQESGFIEKLANLKELFDVKIDYNTEKDDEAKSARVIAMFREMKDDIKINQDELIKQVIKIGFGIEDVERFLSGEMTPDELIKSIEYMMEVGLMDEQMGTQMIEQIIQAQQESEGGDRSGIGGRPPVQDPVSIVQDQMPGSDELQMEAQADAAYKQTGVDKGPQNV